MMRRLRLILLLVLATAWLPANATLRAWVDNPTIAPGDTVQLTLAHDGQTGTRPDLRPLKQDFDILGSSTSTSLQIVNGRASATTQLELSLAPKHSGQLTIPSITWDTDRSPALTLNVTSNAGNTNSGANANATTAGSGGHLFLETETDPKAPYVQAAVHVTVRVYAGVPLSHGDLEFADTDAAIVRQVGSDSISNIERDDQPYQVITRHYIVFPQHSGRLTIDGPTLSGEVIDRSRRADPFAGVFGNSPFGGMLAARKPIRVHADPIVLDVQPRPASAGASYWLPARNLTLQGHWAPSLQAHVGDPVTLDMKLQAQGLTAAQLPDLASLLHLPPQLKTYPDQPKLTDDPQGADIIGTREQSIAVIADEPGQFAIPELRLSWWDTQTNQTREAILPAQTLTVQPAPGTAASVATPAQNAQSLGGTTANKQTPNAAPANGPAPLATREPATWKWVSLVLGLLWVGTLLAWLRTRGRGGPNRPTRTVERSDPTSGMKARPLRAAFLAACRNNDASEARRNLLLWANAIGPGAPIRGLNALGKLTDDPEVTRELQALDRACYAGASWNGSQLAALLSELSVPTEASPGRRSRELAPLYR
jgi:hypothetical protein